MSATGSDDSGTTRVRPEAIRAVPVRHPGRWISAAIIALVAGQIGHWFFTNQLLGFAIARRHLFDRVVLLGVWATIQLTLIAMVMGVAIGLVLAVMRLSKNPVVSGAAWFYIWFFRGTPVLVQLLFWFNLPGIVHAITVGIPFGPGWLVTNHPAQLVTAFIAASLGLGLNEGAYMAEIARAGILSVDDGQVEAASALGMAPLQIMRRVVLPQAMKVIIPPTGNETISMLKTTSLAYTITLLELLGAVSRISDRTYETVPLLLTASMWYLFMTTILSIGQYYLERRYARGSARDLPLTPRQRALRFLATRQAARARSRAGVR